MGKNMIDFLGNIELMKYKMIIVCIGPIIGIIHLGCSSGIVTDDINNFNFGDTLYNAVNYKEFVDGSCKKVPQMYHLNTIVYGQYNQGYSGDFDCWSDVYLKHGVRISPNNDEGRAWYDFGPVEKDTITVTIQWVDNAWFSASKKLEMYDWEKMKWKTIKKWSDNDGEEHFDTFKIKLNSEFLDASKKIRVGLFSSGFAIIHLNSIKLN